MLAIKFISPVLDEEGARENLGKKRKLLKRLVDYR